MSEIKSFESLAATPAPVMPQTPDTAVSLIRGINLGDTWLDTAHVREMTGADEEFLASMETRTNANYADYVLALLKRTTVSIGDISIANNPEVLNELIIGDRDLLFLNVIKATYGNNREFKVMCPHCSKSNDLLVNLSEDFPIEGDPQSARKPISVTLRNGMTLTVNHPTAVDSAAIGKSNKNTAQQNTMMIAKCVVIDVPNKEEWARTLNVADRSTIVNAIFDAKIGPSPREVNAPCGHCGESITLMFDWVSLLFG